MRKNSERKTLIKKDVLYRIMVAILLLCLSGNFAPFRMTASAAGREPEQFNSYEDLILLCKNAKGKTESTQAICFKENFVIQEDLVIPSDLHLQFTELVIPEGVTLTVSKYSSLLITQLKVDGVLFNRGNISISTWHKLFPTAELIFGEEGFIENKGSLSLQKPAPNGKLKGNGTVTVKQEENASCGSLKELEAQVQAAIDNPDSDYKTSYVGKKLQLTRDLTIPHNMNLTFVRSEGIEVVVPENCSLTVLGAIQLHQTRMDVFGEFINQGKVFTYEEDSSIVISKDGTYSGKGEIIICYAPDEFFPLEGEDSSLFTKKYQDDVFIKYALRNADDNPSNEFVKEQGAAPQESGDNQTGTQRGDDHIIFRTIEDLMEILAMSTENELFVTGVVNQDYMLEEDLIIPTGKRVFFSEGTVTVTPGITLTVEEDAALYFYGLDVQGTIINNGDLVQCKELNGRKQLPIRIEGKVINSDWFSFYEIAEGLEKIENVDAGRLYSSAEGKRVSPTGSSSPSSTTSPKPSNSTGSAKKRSSDNSLTGIFVLWIVIILASILMRNPNQMKKLDLREIRTEKTGANSGPNRDKRPVVFGSRQSKTAASRKQSAYSQEVYNTAGYSETNYSAYDNQRRMKQLDDWLKSGLIDKDEYLRLKDLYSGKP